MFFNTLVTSYFNKNQAIVLKNFIILLIILIYFISRHVQQKKENETHFYFRNLKTICSIVFNKYYQKYIT